MLTKRQIKDRIYLSGVFGKYVVRTGGLAGLPQAIPTASFVVGCALVRELRRQAGNEALWLWSEQSAA